MALKLAIALCLSVLGRLVTGQLSGSIDAQGVISGTAETPLGSVSVSSGALTGLSQLFKDFPGLFNWVNNYGNYKVNGLSKLGQDLLNVGNRSVYLGLSTARDATELGTSLAQNGLNGALSLGQKVTSEAIGVAKDGIDAAAEGVGMIPIGGAALQGLLGGVVKGTLDRVDGAVGSALGAVGGIGSKVISAVNSAVAKGTGAVGTAADLGFGTAGAAIQTGKNFLVGSKN